MHNLPSAKTVAVAGSGAWSSEDTYNVYSLGGFREVSKDGYILGTFTDQSGSNASTVPKSKVYFIRIPTR